MSLPVRSLEGGNQGLKAEQLASEQSRNLVSEGSNSTQVVPFLW